MHLTVKDVVPILRKSEGIPEKVFLRVLVERSHAQAYSNLAFLSLPQQVPFFRNQSQTENCFEECLQFVVIIEATMW